MLWTELGESARALYIARNDSCFGYSIDRFPILKNNEYIEMKLRILHMILWFHQTEAGKIETIKPFLELNIT